VRLHINPACSAVVQHRRAGCLTVRAALTELGGFVGCGPHVAVEEAAVCEALRCVTQVERDRIFCRSWLHAMKSKLVFEIAHCGRLSQGRLYGIVKL